MVMLQFVVKGWVVWAGLLTLALGLLLGLRARCLKAYYLSASVRWLSSRA
jgi:hypothetical protein